MQNVKQDMTHKAAIEALVEFDNHFLPGTVASSHQNSRMSNSKNHTGSFRQRSSSRNQYQRNQD